MALPKTKLTPYPHVVFSSRVILKDVYEICSFSKKLFLNIFGLEKISRMLTSLCI